MIVCLLLGSLLCGFGLAALLGLFVLDTWFALRDFVMWVGCVWIACCWVYAIDLSLFVVLILMGYLFSCLQ